MRPVATGTILTALFVAACSHAEPFGTEPERLDTPPVPGNPATLTRNPFQDLYPVWSPDGSTILYTFESSDAQNRDRCLGLLPAGGGTRLGQACNTSAGHLDSTEAYGPSAISPAGRLAYRYAQSIPGRENPDAEELRVATLAHPHDYQVVTTLPTNVQGTTVDGIGALQWLSETRLVYLALKIQYSGTPRDTLVDGLAVILVDLAGGVAPAIVPGTLNATSVAGAESSESIIYTLAGDSRVYQQGLTTGVVTTLHDFGPLGIVRDAVQRGNRLLAVVGGEVTFSVDPVLGTRQQDQGGPLYQVDLANGTVSALPPAAAFFYRRPALAPEGTIAVEGYRVTTTIIPPTPQNPTTDTITVISTLADLLLFSPPGP
jgi:hypothetical protein